MGYLLAALIGGLLAFNSIATPHQAARVAEKALRREYPGAQVHVDIQGRSGFPVLHGKFHSVRVEMAHLSLRGFPLQPSPPAPLPSSTSTSTPPAAATPPEDTGQPAPSQTPPVAEPQPVATEQDGHTERIEIVLRDFTWNNLHVDFADFVLNDISYDWGKLKGGGHLSIVNCGPALATMTIPASALQDLLVKKLKDISDPQLSLKDGLAQVTGKKTVLFMPLSFVFTGRPEAHNGNEIWIVDPKLKTGPDDVVPLPVEKIVGHLNPIYVFDRQGRWPFRVDITNIDARDDMLNLSADLKFKGTVLPSP